MKKGQFILFLIKCGIYTALVLGIIISTNFFVDASSTIRPMHSKMAQLALKGNIVAAPENYNERAYQACIVNEMKRPPETIVIGSSRGMFLGKEITHIEDIYNNCVSGGCVEDYYALLGLYHRKFGKVPKNIIIEVSPWVFYQDNTEDRWKDNGEYTAAAKDYFALVNDSSLKSGVRSESPYLSISYFQYNLEELLKNGTKALEKKEEARISRDENEAADYPDGTIRYDGKLERESAERTANVKNTKGACTYGSVHLMMEISDEKREYFESLIDYLMREGCDIKLYLQPFSVTQCEYSIDKGENIIFLTVEEYLSKIAEERKIELVGGYDSRKMNLTDEYFIDFMHLDKIGTDKVWNINYKNR